MGIEIRQRTGGGRHEESRAEARKKNLKSFTPRHRGCHLPCGLSAQLLIGLYPDLEHVNRT